MIQRQLQLFAITLLIPFGIVAQRVPHTVIVVLDGSRYSETFGDTSHQYIPHLWNDLKDQGTLYTSFYNDGETKTNPGHSAVITGTWQPITNDGTERPHSPTLFEYFRKQTGSSYIENQVVLGKSKLNVLSHSDHAEYGSTYAAATDQSSPETDDNAVFLSVRNVLSSYHPKLLITNFPTIDVRGHAGDWNGYLSAIRNADSLVWELWKFIQSDQVLAGNTMLVITNDHGRHLDGISTGYRDHGDGCDGCRHIMLMMLGPTVTPGRIDTNRYTQVDIAPTVAAYMNFSVPLSIGTSIQSALATSISDESPSIPLGARLTNVFPNPFNPSTGIEYSLPGRSSVTLSIFDVRGRQIETLINAERPAGDHRVLWTSSATSGMYIVVLESQNLESRIRSTDMRKVVLLR